MANKRTSRGGDRSEPETAALLEAELRRRGMSGAEIEALLRKKRRRRILEFDLVKSRHLINPTNPNAKIVRRNKPTRRDSVVRSSDELCTVEFAAEQLKLHPRTVHRFIHEGRLPARRIGRAYRIRRSDLNAFAGLPAAATAATASLTSFVDVPEVGPEAAKLWKRTVANATASRGPTAPGAQVMYDAEARHLKVIVVGTPDASLSLLALVQIWLKQIRE